MFKNGIFYIAIFLLSIGGVGCSSNSGSGEDLDISEIQEIEATGEFSEDEFFSNESAGDLAEEKLVEEVPGLEDEIGVDIAGASDSLDENLDLDVSTSEDVAKLDGAELFENTDDLIEEPTSGNVTVTADDLGFEEDNLDGVGGDLNASNASLDELDLDTADDDLFREDVSANVAMDDEFKAQEQSASDLLGEDVSVDVDYSDVASSEKSAANLLNEDVSIDVDYSNQAALGSEKSAAQLLGEDTSIDVDYSGVVASTPRSRGGLLPVRKMETVPYSKNGVLVNTIYFVRQGDSLRGIADKIYGKGSAVDFTIVNPHLKRGALKVGQKVYYNSPTRSQDRSRLITYYEDVRIPAQTYAAQQGQNIRTVSKNLLGHSRSWMEVWASNQQISSKGALEAPYQVRYWNGSNAPAPVLAKNNAPAPTPEAVVEELEPEQSSSQASLDLDTDDMIDEPIDQPIAAVDEPIDEPDMELDMPADVSPTAEEVAIDEPPLAEDLTAADAAAMDAEADMAMENENNQLEDPAAVAALDGRDIARNQGNAFPAKNSNGMMRQGIIGVALLLLLIVGFLVIRKRKQSQDAIEMESFDFGGETTIEEAQTKTQIDL